MRIALLILILWFVPFPSWAGSLDYVGGEKCKSCHEAAYQTWSRGPHAVAFERLPENKKTELRCLFCHATDAQANMAHYRFLNVQCEACHGPGRRHLSLAKKGKLASVKRAGLEKASKETCRVCHSAAQTPLILPFQAEKAWDNIKHW